MFKNPFFKNLLKLRNWFSNFSEFKINEQKQIVFLYTCVCVCVCMCKITSVKLLQFRLFVTPWTVAHQAPLSMVFCSQEYCSGLPCPPPGDLPYLCLMSPALAGRFFTTNATWIIKRKFKKILFKMHQNKTFRNKFNKTLKISRKINCISVFLYSRKQ